MNQTFESLLRFVNLASTGLLAGSLGFGEVALVPGWKNELPRNRATALDKLKTANYFEAIGPVALGTSVALAVAARRSTSPRVLDAISACALAGVLVSTVLVTVPINQDLEGQPASDYANEQSILKARNWSRAHAVRTTLGLGAFFCALSANLSAHPK